MKPSTIFSLNELATEEKRAAYVHLIPRPLLARFCLSTDLKDCAGNDLLELNCPPGSATAEMTLRHEISFPDPVLYGHITDTVYGQLHILLYVLNDPDSPRFDVDRLPDGRPTEFGTNSRNIEAELAAMEFGLAPGQVRRGLRMLGSAIAAFEQFVSRLGHDLFFVEPLFYHNAVIFERYGFSYQTGRRLMERIQTGFHEGGDLLSRLDGSTPFRLPEAANHIRLRSWAIHDGLLGEPFTKVTMYKRIGQSARAATCPGCPW